MADSVCCKAVQARRCQCITATPIAELENSIAPRMYTAPRSPTRMGKGTFSQKSGGVRSASPRVAAFAPIKTQVVGHAVFWIAAHMLSSSCLMVLNKLAVFRGAAEKKAPALPVFTVMALQTAFSVAFVARDYRAVTRQIALHWMPVAVLFISMLGSSSLALSLQSVSVSFLVVFRNLISVFVAAFEFFVQGQCISMARLGGLLAMLQGAALYAVGDAAAAAVKHTHPNVETSEVLSLRLFGYLLVAINLSSTFAYTIICKRALKKLELQPNVAALLNNAYALPVFFSAAVWFEGLDLGVLEFAGKASATQWLVLMLSCAVGHCLSVAGLNVQKLITATSFTVIVNTSKAVTLIMGVYLLKEASNASASAGMCLSVVGAALYALLP